MPSVSEPQRRAMFAAAAGKSTIGIPKKVGKEFADADQGGKLPSKPRGSPKSRDEHMAKRAKETTQANVGKEFGKHQTSVSRAIRKGYTPGGSAR